MNSSTKSDFTCKLRMFGSAGKPVSEKVQSAGAPSAAKPCLKAFRKRRRRANSQIRWHLEWLVYNPDRKKGCAISSLIRRQHSRQGGRANINETGANRGKGSGFTSDHFRRRSIRWDNG